MNADAAPKDLEVGQGRGETDLILAALADASCTGGEVTQSGDPPGASGAAFLGGISLPGYDIAREVHRGGQGVVYQAVNRATRRKVAIKVMHEGALAAPRERARFEREVEIVSRLEHPNVVAIHDSGSQDGLLYHVMDYVSGRAVDSHVRERRLPARDVLDLVARIAEAVAAVHLRGVIHRDLKPSNILIDDSGAPHILDFGLAKVGGASIGPDEHIDAMTVTGQFVGSLPWASPEQAEGAHHLIDMRSDIYSLGVVLYELLTGRFPYDVSGSLRKTVENIVSAPPASPRTCNAEIDDEMETIVLRCLNKDPARRYQSAAELARDIRHYLNGEPIDAKRDSAWYVVRKTLARHRVAVAAAAAFVVLCLASAAGMSILYGQARRAERATSERAEKALATAAMLDTLVRAIDPVQDGSIREMEIVEAVEQAASHFEGDHTAQARMHYSAAVALRYLSTFGLNQSRLFDLTHQQVVAAIESQRAAGDASAVRRMEFFLAGVLGAGGRLDETRQLLDRLEREISVHGNEPSMDRLFLLDLQAQFHEISGDYEAAIALRQSAVEESRMLRGSASVPCLLMTSRLVDDFCMMQRFDEALATAVAWLERIDPDDRRAETVELRAAGFEMTGNLCALLGRPQDAAEYARRLHEELMLLRPADDPSEKK